MSLERAIPPRADETQELDLDEAQLEAARLEAAARELEPDTQELEPITQEIEAVTTEVAVVAPGALEQDELTVRRSFAPKQPPKVAV